MLFYLAWWASEVCIIHVHNRIHVTMICPSFFFFNVLVVSYRTYWLGPGQLCKRYDTIRIFISLQTRDMCHNHHYKPLVTISNQVVFHNKSMERNSQHAKESIEEIKFHFYIQQCLISKIATSIVTFRSFVHNPFPWNWEIWIRIPINRLPKESALEAFYM